MSRNFYSRSDEVQRDLDDLGTLLRGYRENARIFGREASRRAGFTQSKLSKIENGVLLPSIADVQQLLAGLGTSPSSQQHALQLIRRIHANSGPPRIVLHRGAITRHSALLAQFGAHGRVAVVETAVVPGWLRTRDYLLAAAEQRSRGSTRAATSLLVRRQELLTKPGITFNFFLREAAMRTCVGSPRIMADQLHEITSIAERYPNVAVRVIANETVITPPPTHGFELHNDRHAVFTVLPGIAVITGDADIQLFQQIIASLRKNALNERESQKVLCRIAEEFEQLAAR